jgi:hypothetical protein
MEHFQPRVRKGARFFCFSKFAKEFMEGKLFDRSRRRINFRAWIIHPVS